MGCTGHTFGKKAFLTAQKHWERDEVDEQSYQTIQRKYDELLPEAKEILLDMDSDAVVRDTLNKYLSASQQKQLLESKRDVIGLFRISGYAGSRTILSR